MTTNFTVHTAETAPEESKALLQDAQDAYGMVPNIFGVMADVPPTLEAYQALGKWFSQTSLSTMERNVVWLTVSAANDCRYCIPAHTAIAKKSDVPDDVIDAIRNGTPINDDKLETLRKFTEAVVTKRGNVPEDTTKTFLDAGYTERNIIEVILGVTHKTLSNYINHFAQTEVDESFKPFAWIPSTANKAA